MYWYLFRPLWSDDSYGVFSLGLRQLKSCFFYSTLVQWFLWARDTFRTVEIAAEVRHLLLDLGGLETQGMGGFGELKHKLQRTNRAAPTT